MALAVAAAAAPVALGAKPDRMPAESGPLYFDAGVVCPFAVSGEVVANRQTETVFSNGTTKITGFFASLIRNEDNGKELTFTTPGVVEIVPVDDTHVRLVTTGPIIVFFFPGDAGPGNVATGRTYLFHGRVEVLIDLAANFIFREFSATGRATDLCQALS